MKNKREKPPFVWRAIGVNQFGGKKTKYHAVKTSEKRKQYLLVFQSFEKQLNLLLKDPFFYILAIDSSTSGLTYKYPNKVAGQGLLNFAGKTSLPLIGM